MQINLLYAFRRLDYYISALDVFFKMLSDIVLSLLQARFFTKAPENIREELRKERICFGNAERYKNAKA